jgi:hypothetical protein
MQFLDLASPFATFEGGSGYVLPNVLPELARSVVARTERESMDDIISSLNAKGRQPLNQTTSVHDSSNVWNFFLSQYLARQGPDTPSALRRAEMLKVMLSAPPAEAWLSLKTQILDDIDNLSGWSRSFQKELGERDQI